MYKHKVQYYETDQMGIVHHSNYIRWFEEARMDFMEKMGMGYDQMESQGILSPVLSVEAKYLRMVHFGDTVSIETAIKEIEDSNGRCATEEEIAGNLGISMEEYAEWQSQMKITNVVSLNEYMEQGSEVPNEKVSSKHFSAPEAVVEENELKETLKDALNLLTEKERKVVLLYYYEELTLKEISNILEVSESRISQLHTRALQKMKDKLGKYMGVLSRI